MQLNFIKIMLLGACISLLACNQSPEMKRGPQVDLSGYKQAQFDDGVIYVYKLDEGNNIIEDGYVKYGTQQGPWSTYTPDGRITATVMFVDGIKTGKTMVFDKLMNLQSIESYGNGQLNGMSSFFKRGRYSRRMNYKDGKLNGLGEEFFTTGMDQGKLQKRMHFKNGELDGKMEFFNEAGDLTLEYEYRNGKQVSGGDIKK